MHVTGMTVDRAPMLTHTLDLSFDESVNLFIGPNASGKSSLLRMLGMPVHDGARYGSGNWFQYVGQFGLTVSPDWPVQYPGQDEVDTRWGVIPWVQICATRLNLPWWQAGEVPELDPLVNEGEALAKIFRHGYEQDIFDAKQVEIALQLITNEAQKKVDKGGISSRIRHDGMSVAKYNLKYAMDISYHCAQQVTSEVVTGSRPHNIVTGETNFTEDLYIRHPEVRLGMSIDTVDRNSVAMNYLSSGTQTSLLWIRFLALQMLYRYDFADGWEKQPTILLIDEIENHLHPTWQRRVIPALLEHFPGLQIFATTHSPFVVAGLKAGQVHLLNRDANGVVTASTNEHDIIGWTTDEILRTFMGVDEPTDQLTIDRRERLLELRRKDSLTAEEEAEMGELRRHVNEDFLSSSTPLEAQRERYGDMMLEFLRSRQSELSQDGS